MEWRVLASVNERLNCASAKKRGESLLNRYRFIACFYNLLQQRQANIQRSCVSVSRVQQPREAVSKGESAWRDMGKASKPFGWSRGAQAASIERGGVLLW